MKNALAIGGIALFAFATIALASSDAQADKKKKVFVEAGDDGVEMVWIRLSAKQVSAIEDAKDADKPTALSRIQRAVLKKVLGGSGSDYKWSKVSLRVTSDQLRDSNGDRYVLRTKQAFDAKKSDARFEE
jgi:hypothetical protein